MTLLLLLFYCAPLVETAAESILKSDIKLLTFVSGYMSTARRTAAIQQLECAGEYCADFLRPKTVQCHNIGFDGKDVRWYCYANLENGIEFGRTDVSCEGFAFADDPVVLLGSCGLEYELVPVNRTWKDSPFGAYSSVLYAIVGTTVGIVAVAMLLLRY